MRIFAPLALLLGACASTATSSAPPQARAEKPHPGPCATQHNGPEGSVRIEYEYDARRRVVREIESRGVQRLSSYDDAGRRTRQLVIDGRRMHAIWYVYDGDGQLVAIEEDATGTHDVVLTRAREYDARGRLVRLATRRGTELLEASALHYDARGRLAWELVERGDDTERIDIELDASGRIVARRSPVEAQAFLYAGPRLAWMIVERGGRAHSLQRYAYDEAGNLLRADTYDGSGRRLRSTTHEYTCW